jgi:hypothetical protein
MTRSARAGLASALLAGLFAGHAAVAGEGDCPPHQVAGYVSTLERSQGDATTIAALLPQRVHGNARAVDLGVGDEVCGRDLVYSPDKSPWTAVVVLSGGAVLRVAPGARARRAPDPTLWTMAEDLKARFDQLFTLQEIDRVSAARGLATKDVLADTPPKSKVVREWGPLIIAWRNPRRDNARQIEIAVGETRVTRTVSGDFIRLDLDRDCPKGCRLSTDDLSGILSYPLDIEVVPENTAPRPAWLPTVGVDAASRALEGRWLLDESGQPDWSLQARSALWSAACAYPVVFHRLHLHHSRVDDTELCRANGQGGPG